MKRGAAQAREHDHILHTPEASIAVIEKSLSIQTGAVVHFSRATVDYKNLNSIKSSPSQAGGGLKSL